MNGWKLVAKTETRTSLQNGNTGETVEIAYHDNFSTAHDVHTIMYSPSAKAEAFYALHCDGLFRVDYTSVRVSPPPSLSEVAKLEQHVADLDDREKIFQKIIEASQIIPKREDVESIIENSREKPVDLRLGNVPADIYNLDLTCINGERTRAIAADSNGPCVGVDLRPPIINGEKNAHFFRMAPVDFLIFLRQRQISPMEISADFLLGGISDSQRTSILNSICERLASGGIFRFCERIADAKKVVATAKMMPDLNLRSCGFDATREWMEKSPACRKEMEKFRAAHPDFPKEAPAAQAQAEKGDGIEGEPAGKDSAKPAESAEPAQTPAAPQNSTVPASLPVLVEITKD